jgi:hypothetical protein
MGSSGALTLQASSVDAWRPTSWPPPVSLPPAERAAHPGRFVRQILILQRHLIADCLSQALRLSGAIGLAYERCSVGANPDFMGRALLSVAEVLSRMAKVVYRATGDMVVGAPEAPADMAKPARYKTSLCLLRTRPLHLQSVKMFIACVPATVQTDRRRRNGLPPFAPETMVHLIWSRNSARASHIKTAETRRAASRVTHRLCVADCQEQQF